MMKISSLPVLDWELSVKLAGNKTEIATEVFGLLKKTLLRDISTIVDFYKSNDLQELLRSVHRLHGAVCYCGVPRLKTILMRMESDLKQNMLIRMPSLLRRLTKEADILLAHNPPLH